MHAVITTGGFQYRVTTGQVIKVQKIELEIGRTVELEALAVGDGEDIKVGSPTVAGSKVVMEIINHQLGDKVTTIKFRRRKHSMKKIGHRQRYTYVRITSIAA